MIEGLPLQAISIGAAVIGGLGLILFLAGLLALFRARFWRFASRAVVGLLLLVAGLVVGGLSLGLEGYQRLTHEELIARIEIEPIGPRRFNARFTFPASHIVNVELAGDEIQVDARIIKWHAWANLLGLHTFYQLDRVAGRYRDIEDERKAVRTIHSLAGYHRVDLFAWRQRLPELARFFDAEYGSASFVPADRRQELELTVSTSGLVLRPRRPN